jgi:hypothetical protein
MLLELLIVLIEFSELVRENVSVWNEVKMLLSKSFLHSDNVEAESILPCDFMTLREMVDLLVLVKAFIQIAFAAGRTPKYVPLMGLCWSKACSFDHGSDELIIKSNHLVEELTIFNMVAFLVSIELHSISHHLLLSDGFKNKKLGLVLGIGVSLALGVSLVVEETGRSTMCTTHR